MANKRVAVRRKPRTWSVGLFVAGVMAVIYYRATDGFTWWMLALCIIVSLVVDKIWYGKIREKAMYIEDDV